MIFSLKLSIDIFGSSDDGDDDDALCNSGIDKLTQWWEAVWSTESKCDLGFDTLFNLEEQNSKLEKLKYIGKACHSNLKCGINTRQMMCFLEPDRIKAPKVLLNTSKDRPPSPKMIWSRRSSEATDLEFDYGAAIGLQPEEWPSIRYVLSFISAFFELNKAIASGMLLRTAENLSCGVA